MTGDEAHRRVMIVDDSALFREALASMFQLIRWEVVEASSGEQALAMLASASPNLIVVDQRMPRLTGAEMYLRLRNKGDRTPVILVSAAMEVHEVAHATGIEHALQKPFDLEALEAVVSRAAAR